MRASKRRKKEGSMRREVSYNLPGEGGREEEEIEKAISVGVDSEELPEESTRKGG